MADAIVAHGCHALAVKDMAGLLKPNAATLLVGALRAAHPDVVIHVHTHDSAGTAVATQLAAAAAGADIVDLAMDSMSGCTSQVITSPYFAFVCFFSLPLCIFSACFDNGK
jgi:pyruvate carboxylase